MSPDAALGTRLVRRNTSASFVLYMVGRDENIGCNGQTVSGGVGVEHAQALERTYMQMNFYIFHTHLTLMFAVSSV
jgi:hypothetical protein